MGIDPMRRAELWTARVVLVVMQEEVALGSSDNAMAPADLPAQLLFIHAGQTDVKEAHWHAQIPGMLASTAADGLHVFKPYNILE
jgi:ribosome assembly protein RRB1